VWQLAALLAGLPVDRVMVAGYTLGGMFSAVAGLIVCILNNGLFLLNVSPFWQQVVKGFVILAAVVIDRMNQLER